MKYLLSFCILGLIFGCQVRSNDFHKIVESEIIIEDSITCDSIIIEKFILPVNGLTKSIIYLDVYGDIVEPTSIICTDSIFYLTSPGNGRIIGYNHINNSIITSDSLYRKDGYYHDIAIYNKTILATTTLGNIIKFDLSLNEIERNQISKTAGEFYSIENDSIRIIYPSDNLQIYTLDSTLKSIYKAKIENNYNMAHGKSINNKTMVLIDNLFDMLNGSVSYTEKIFKGRMNYYYTDRRICTFAFSKDLKEFYIFNVACK